MEKRVLLILGENFEEIEFAAFTGVLGWATHTRPVSNTVLQRAPGGGAVSSIEIIVAGFCPEVHGMNNMRIRPNILVCDLKEDDIDRFDAVAIPACVGVGRGQHTDKGQKDLLSKQMLNIVRCVYDNGGIIATMCWAEHVLAAAKLPHHSAYANYPLYVEDKDGPFLPLNFDRKMRTITCGGPLVAMEAACLLLKELVGESEYRIFRQNNPWLFGISDEFAPRVEIVK